MSSNTTNYALVKPGQDDFYNVDDFNGNADIVDEVISAHVNDKNNPHGVTLKQLGGTSSTDFTNHVNNKSNPHEVTLKQLDGASSTDLTNHVNDKNNPHNVKVAQVEGAAKQTDVDLINNNLGVVNLLENSATTQTKSGIQLSKNTDGSITLNGTSTANIDITLSSQVFDADNYILSCITNIPSGVYLSAMKSDGYDASIKNGSNYIGLSNVGIKKVHIWINSGVVLDNLTLYPMLVKGSTVPTAYIPSIGADTVTGAIVQVNESLGDVSETVTSHINDKLNPHAVTKGQVGLGNCDNTADADKPISTAAQTKFTELQDALTILQGLISKDGFTAPVSDNKKFTYVSGGYKKIGKLVLVDITYYLASGTAVDTYDIATGFPYPTGNGIPPLSVYASTSDNFVCGFGMTSSGGLRCHIEGESKLTSGQNYRVTGYYYAV